MHPNETESVVECQPPRAETWPNAPASAMDPMAQEALALNLEASLRIYTDHHFFGWTQGLLQNLVRHEVLICSLRKGQSELSEVEVFSTASGESRLFAQLYRQDASFAEDLVRKWESNYFQPVIQDASGDDGVAECNLARELTRIGADRIIAHGTHDASARMASFFVFGCRANDADAGVARRVEMVVPFLHTAWMRTKVGLSANAGESHAHPDSSDLLTPREHEVLKWVYLGKSNIEIGIILGISPLTVKNHVQEILRRLNVQNRTQAVGKAFNLHILNC